jgi:hypothetical protein
MLHLDLLRHRQRPTHRSGVDEDAVVHEECRGPLPLSLAAKRPEDLDLQRFLQSVRFTIARILVQQGSGRQGDWLDRGVRLRIP